MKRAVVGMSGGVDSSVTTYLLGEQGYDVMGISLFMWESNQQEHTACCSIRSVEDASETARRLGIEHNVIDVRDQFLRLVIEPFVKGYIAGSTPNPCILCNQHIKFPSLIRAARKQGVKHIATGHYARVEKLLHAKTVASGKKEMKEGKMFALKKGIDRKKDQSYVLYILGQHELKSLVLPLGDQQKDDVRQLARKLHLPAAERSESQEICFIADRNYSHFIEKHIKLAKQGPILDLDGNMLGRHRGVHRYTVGQRKRIGISSKNPLYVIKIDAARNTLYVGPSEEARKSLFTVSTVNWVIPPPSSDHFRATVKVRSTMKDEPATITLHKKSSRDKGNPATVHVNFDTPQWAPAPGQSAVFYNDDTIVGGGIITDPE